MEYTSLYISVFLVLHGGEVLGYDTGAPKRACVPLVPFHSNVVAQNRTSPYRLTVTATEYTPGAQIAGYLYYYTYLNLIYYYYYYYCYYYHYSIYIICW